MCIGPHTGYFGFVARQWALAFTTLPGDAGYDDTKPTNWEFLGHELWPNFGLD
jgi:hypothetical protein